jgi:hypothetical protein
MSVTKAIHALTEFVDWSQYTLTPDDFFVVPTGKPDTFKLFLTNDPEQGRVGVISFAPGDNNVAAVMLGDFIQENYHV